MTATYFSTNTLLNFTPPPMQMLVGDFDIAPFITSLSISRPLAEINTPLSWTGTCELAQPANYPLLPESLDDLENPSRWARGVHPVRLYFKGVLFATLRILEYYYDEDELTASIQLGDLLGLLDDKAPAQDYKGLGFAPCTSTSVGYLVNVALSSAGVRCIKVGVGGEIPVPPNKPNGSWIRWAQQYLGERGYWLYVEPDECVNAVRYPTFQRSVLLRKSRMGVEGYKRERSPDIPADKIIVTGSTEKYATCGTGNDEDDVSEDFGLIKNKNGQDVRALQRRETTQIIQKATLRRGTSQQGMPIGVKSNYQTVQIRRITVEQAIGVVFPDDYPGQTGIITTERNLEYKAYDSQGRLRARYVKSDRLLGQILPEAFKGDRTMVSNAERILEEWMETYPGVTPAYNDGVVRRKEYTLWSLFAEGTDATQLQGAGAPRVAFGGVNYLKAIKEQTFETWKGGPPPTGGDKCGCDRYSYTKRAWKREQQEVKASEVNVVAANTNYTEDTPYYRVGALQLQTNQSKDNEDSTPPSWETLEPECPTCTIDLKGEASFAAASYSSYRKREEYVSCSTLTNNTEAQQLAHLLGSLAHQRMRSRTINLPMPDEYLVNPTPFACVHIHKGAYVMDNPSLNLAVDGLEVAFKGNYLGAIPQVPAPELMLVDVTGSAYDPPSPVETRHGTSLPVPVPPIQYFLPIEVRHAIAHTLSEVDPFLPSGEEQVTAIHQEVWPISVWIPIEHLIRIDAAIIVTTTGFGVIRFTGGKVRATSPGVVQVQVIQFNGTQSANSSPVVVSVASSSFDSRLVLTADSRTNAIDNSGLDAVLGVSQSGSVTLRILLAQFNSSTLNSLAPRTHSIPPSGFNAREVVILDATSRAIPTSSIDRGRNKSFMANTYAL